MPIYQELQIMSYREACALNRYDLGGGVFLTGHHIIPDHCFYIYSGGRAAQVDQMRLQGTGAYSTDDAPVILLTADASGGKTANHGAVHASFDPVEKARFAGGQDTWTYDEVKMAAVTSVLAVFSGGGNPLANKIAADLDSYFLPRFANGGNQILRCGESANLKHLALVPQRQGRSGGL